MSDKTEEERVITVCDKCLCASCWNSVFYCDDYQNAGVMEKTIAELRELNREHPSYWELCT